jgi:hypothetical protein
MLRLEEVDGDARDSATKKRASTRRLLSIMSADKVLNLLIGAHLVV